MVKEFKSGTISLGIDDIGPTVAGDLIGAKTDNNGVLVSSVEDSAEPVAVGFRARKANGKYRYFWLYRVKFGIPGTSLQTKGDSITFSTPRPLKGLSCGAIKRMRKEIIHGKSK